MNTTGLSDVQRDLVERHIDFADSGARKYVAKYGRLFGFTYDDYRSAAYMGLIQAALKFDPSRGFTFKTYAMDWTEKYLNEVGRAERRSNGWAFSPTRAEQHGGAERNVMVRRLRRSDVPEYRSDGQPNDIGIEILLPPTIEDHDTSIEHRQRLALALRPLTQLQRDILFARANGEMYRQIGKRYGKSYGWVYFVERDAMRQLGAKQTIAAAARD